MENILKGSNSRFVINFFKSVGIACTLMATSSCSDNIVNKTNRGNEIMKPSKLKSVEENMEYAEMDETDNESTPRNAIKKEDYIVEKHEAQKTEIKFKDKILDLKYVKKKLNKQCATINAKYKLEVEIYDLLEKFNGMYCKLKSNLDPLKRLVTSDELSREKSHDNQMVLDMLKLWNDNYPQFMDVYLGIMGKLREENIKIVGGYSVKSTPKVGSYIISAGGSMDSDIHRILGHKLREECRYINDGIMSLLNNYTPIFKDEELKKLSESVLSYKGKDITHIDKDIEKIEYKGGKTHTVKYDKEYYKMSCGQKMKVCSHTEVKFLFENNQFSDVLKIFNDRCTIFEENYKTLEKQCEIISDDKIEEICDLCQLYSYLIKVIFEAVKKLEKQKMKIINVYEKEKIGDILRIEDIDKTSERWQDIDSEVRKTIIVKLYESCLKITHMVEFILEKYEKCFKNSGEFDRYQELVSFYVGRYKGFFEERGKIDAGLCQIIQESLEKSGKI